MNNESVSESQQVATTTESDSVMSKVARTLQVAFDELADKDGFITASQLTQLINEFAERELIDKSVRAHLRQIAARDQSKMKNAVWRIDYALAESEVKHFTRKQQTAS